MEERRFNAKKKVDKREKEREVKSLKQYMNNVQELYFKRTDWMGS